MQTEQELNHFGIDYGSKLAGTTAICFLSEGKLHILQSEKKKDADAFIKFHIQSYQPDAVFLDAPLSLPEVYRNGKGSDFFYRHCDRLMGAMSPLFLGGLTARAMQLNSVTPGVPFYESYPKALVQELKAQDHYKSDIRAFCQSLELPYPLHESPQNWHQVDAILAWNIGYRFKKGLALTAGKPNEGVIYY